MKMRQLVVVFVLISCVIITYIPVCRAGSFHYSDEYYFEDVNVLIIGRCRNIGSDGTWIGGLFIGNQPYPDVQVTDTRFERLRVIIFNNSINDPMVSLSGLINKDIFMHDADGIFFYGCWIQFSARLIPSIVFVYCHADKVWIN